MMTTPAVLLLFGLGWLPWPVGVAPDPDECVLRAAKIDCGNESLIKILGGPRLAERVLTRVDALVQQLGASKFKDRQAAFDALVQIGPPARPALVKAANDPSAEVRRAAERCLRDEAFQGHTPNSIAAAVRLLAKRN